MDSNDTVQPSAFSEEEKLPEVIDEDANWFGKNLGDESDSTVENEGLHSQISQDELGSELVVDKENKPTEEIMESDSPSELLAEMSDGSVEKHGVSLEPKKVELTELKDIEIDSKKHDISNELKEMFEEKSSDAEELQESSLAQHSLDTEITKEDKLKDIVPDDILGKDDSFDELDNDELHQELEAHLTYEKGKELMSDLPQASTDLPDEVPVEKVEESGQDDSQTEQEIDKSLDDLTFEGKSELLKNLAEDIGTKEIDEIMEQEMPIEEDSNSKDITSELKEISSSLEDSCVNELKDDLENQLQNITGENVTENPESENTISEEVVNQVDKASIELNKENMMVEFARDGGNQVLIQINTDASETPTEAPPKTESLVMETSDGQTLVFSTQTMETSSSESDIVSRVEGGAEFLQAVTGKLEDVLMPVKDDAKTQESPAKPVAPVVQSTAVSDSVLKDTSKEESPKCCITTCKSGKSTLRTTYRYFKPPVNKILYKKWEYIFNQARQQMTPTSLICELHFRTGLIYKRGVDKTGKVIWALREGALPKLSPSGVLRVTGGVLPSPSTTIQVPKKPDGLVKSPVLKPLAEAKISPSKSTLTPNITPKLLGKKILQKPVKTVAKQVSNEVTDIGFLYKNPELVKVAQDEITNLDLLVCGECHSVFHILELFQAHKMAANCKGESNFKGNPSEPKPQVWAFLLWKSAQAKVSDVESSWRLYQRWCKMDDNTREAWIAAGKFLQEGNAIASLKLIDSPPYKGNKPGRPPLKDRDSEDEEFTARKTVKKPKVTAPPPPEVDIGAAGDASTFSEPEPMEVETTYVSPAMPAEDAYEIDNTLEDLARRSPEMITSEVEIKQEVMSDDEHGENKENDRNMRQNKEPDEVQNCSHCKEPITNIKAGILCAAGCYGYFHVECTRLKKYVNLSKLGSKRATWKCDACKANGISLPNTQPSEKPKAQPPPSAVVPQTPKAKETEEEEFVVEKIVSRRFNIKKKHFEYLLKWEGYPSEQNTWEPAENLGTCQHLLKAFEEALAKQQAAKQAANKSGPVKQESTFKIKPPVIPKKKPTPSTPGPSTPLVNSMGRPVRSSKQKAMDQVKVWCGSIVRPTEDEYVGLKRKASSDSEYEEEVVVKRVKVERESDDESEESIKTMERATPSRGRGRPPLGSTISAKQPTHPATNYLNKPVINGKKDEPNLAAALGLESDEEEDKAPPVSPQKSPVVRKMSSFSPQNQQVLVASAKGVVKVDPKQVPNLSSGVYIMSNKSGIVKVDNNKTLNTLQKSGIMKKPYGEIPIKTEGSNTSPQKQSTSGVVVLPRAETGTPQQKMGVVKKSPAPAVTPSAATPAAGSTPARPAGLLKPLKAGVTPRPLGLLKPPTSSPASTVNPPPLAPLSSATRPSLGIPPGINTKIHQVVRPRNSTPLRGRQIANAFLKRPVPESPGLQASPQQRLLIAKKKAESVGGDAGTKPAVSISPTKKTTEETRLPLIRPKPESGSPVLPPIRSTNKVFAHPLLNRGRGRGVYRSRGRGSSLGQLIQVSQREVPEAVKESKLVESDNLLMEFQEPSDSEDSDDGVDDVFPNMEELPPIEPDSPPRPLTLCPLTGKVLSKAEGERTPEPTPPPSPKPPTPPPAPSPKHEPTHILPDQELDIKNSVEEPTPVALSASPLKPTSGATGTTTTIVKQDGMICKVEMSPGGTTGTLVEAVSAATATPPGVTEGTVTIKKPLASRNRVNRGPQLSVMPTNSSSTSLGTITVPARKLFQEESGDDDMVTITGEDGLVYQVSNSELTGNTLLVSSGEDGQQQCVYVTTDGDTEEGSTILTLDTAYADAVAQLGTDQVNILSTENGDQYFIKEGDDGDQLMTLEGEEGVVGDDQSGQVVAQLVEAGEPAPGGSRRVVLLLPDGNLMMTEVDEEQYAALDLDK